MISRQNINTLEKQLYQVTTKLFKQRNKYFVHHFFHLQRPTAVVVRVFCYNLQIIIIFVPDKEATNSSELSVFLQDYSRPRVTVTYLFITMAIKTLHSWCQPLTEKTSSDKKVNLQAFNVSFAQFRRFDGFQNSCKILSSFSKF